MAEMSVRSILKRAGATKHYLGIEYLIEALKYYGERGEYLTADEPLKVAVS